MNGQSSPQTAKIGSARNSLKDRSTSNSKINKARLNRRNSVEQQLQQFDKIKILSVERIIGVFNVQICRTLSKGLFKLIINGCGQNIKKHGFALLDVIFNAKVRQGKQQALRALKQNSKRFSLILKFCTTFIRMNLKFENKRKKQIINKLQNNVKFLKQSQSSPEPISRSLGKKPSLPPKRDTRSMTQIQSVTNQNQKMMLSNQIRQVLSQLQRYDRVMYLSQVQKHLKVSAQTQVKRLQKIKNANKSMQGQLYDNELTIIVISNLMRSVNELMRQSQNVMVLLEQKKQLQKKIIETNSQKAQQIKQLRQTFKSRQSQQISRAKLLDNEAKQFHKMTQTLNTLYQQNNFQKIKRSLEAQINRLNNDNKEMSLDKKQILSILLNLTYKQKSQAQIINSSNVSINNINIELKSLIEQNSSNDKNLKTLEKQKRLFETKFKQAKQDIKDYYQSLIGVTSTLYSLNSEIATKNNQILDLNNKLKKSNNSKQEKGQAINFTIDRLKEDLDQKISNSKQTEDKLKQSHKSKQSKKNMLQDWVRQWQQIMQDMIQRIKSGDNSWINDITKKKKWLNAHKNNQQLTKMVNNDVTLLNIISGKEKLEISYKSSPQRPSFRKTESTEQDRLSRQKMKELSRQNDLLTKQLQHVNSRLNIIQSQSVSHIQISNLEQIIFNINQTLISEQRNNPQYWLKLRAAFQNSKNDKISNIVICLSKLIQIIELQLLQKMRLYDQFKQTSDEITTLKASTKAFSMIVYNQINDDNLDKMMRNVKSVVKQLQNSKDKNGQVSSLINLYLEETKSKVRLLEIIGSQIINSRQLRQQITDYMLKLKQIQIDKQLNQKLNIQLEPMSLVDSGQRLNDLMKIESSIEDIVQDKDDDKFKYLEKQNDILKTQLLKYQAVLQKYTSEQKMILQRMQQYEYTLNTERQRVRSLEYSNQLLSNQKRQLSYQLNIIMNQKTSISEKQYQQRGRIVQQLEMKEKVIKQLSKDITNLDSKIKRLQDQNEKLDALNKDLNQKLIDVDAANIDLKQRTAQYQNLKEQVVRLVRQNSIKSMHDQESNVREIQLSTQLQQYKTLIDQLSNKIEQLEAQKSQIQTKVKSVQQQNYKLLVQLQRTLTDRQNSFKQYQQIIETSERQKHSLQFKVKQKQMQIKNITQQISRNTKSIGQYQGMMRETQIKLSKDIEGMVGQRLTSQEQYYKNLLSTSNTSYESIIKNQVNQIERLNKQILQNGSQLTTIQQLQLKILKQKQEILSSTLDKQQIIRKLQLNDQIIEALKSRQNGHIQQINLLKNKLINDLDIEGKIKDELQSQEAYFNNIINSNADCYINNQKSFLSQIQKYRAYINELQTLLKQRQLTITNQSQQFENRIREIQMLKQELSCQRSDENKIITEVQHLKEQLKSKQGGPTDDQTVKAKLAYLEQNESYLRAQIQRLVHQNRILTKQKQKQSKDDGKQVAEDMKLQLRQLQSMLNMLKEQKQKAISHYKIENQDLKRNLKQTQIQLIQQQKYTSTLINQFKQRQKELIDGINNTDTVNRQLSDHIEAITNQYNNLKSILQQDTRRLEKPPSVQLPSGSAQYSLAEKLKMLSLSDNAFNNQDDDIPGIKIKTEQGQIIHPFSLTESKQIENQGNDSINMGFSSGQSHPKSAQERYLIMSQQNESLIFKLNSLRSELHEKEIQIFQMGKSWQSLQNENKRLILQLKRLNSKMVYSQANNVLQVDNSNNTNQLIVLQSELNKVMSENTFLKYKSSYLQNQLKQQKNPRMNRSISAQGGLLKNESRRFISRNQSKNIIGEKHHDLAHRLNSIISNNQQATQEDLLEINILRKISDEVGQLVQSNNKLIEKLRLTEEQNQSLYETINKLSAQSPKHNNTSQTQTMLVLHKVLISIMKWLQQQNYISRQDIKIYHVSQKLQNYLKKNNVNRYVQIIEQILRNLIIRVAENKQQQLSHQADQLIQMRGQLAQIVSGQIQQMSESQIDQDHNIYIDSIQKVDQVGALLKAYSKNKNTRIINEVEKLLHKKKKNQYK